MHKKQITRLVLCTTAKLSMAAWLLSAPEAVIAQVPADGGVKVSVSYEVKMKRPEDESKANDAMRQARQIIYLRVKEECIDMKQHVARTCELTSLDIQQKNARVRRSNRSTEGESFTVRARATYKIELNDQMK